MESRNIVLMNLFAVSNGETDTENRLMDMGERDGEGEMYGESSMETYITIYKIDSQWEPGFPVGSESKESSCNVGDVGSIPVLGRSPGGGHDNTLQFFCLENPHGQRSLVRPSPWGQKESDTNE